MNHTYDTGIRIEPLSYRSLRGAYRALREAFPNSGRWYCDLLASLNPCKRLGIPRLGGCDFLQYWVAVKSHHVIGVTGMYVVNLTYDNTAWIGWTTVRESSRGQGLGRHLIEHVLSQAKQHGVDCLAVYTSPQHSQAIRLYRSLGFQEEQGREQHLVFREMIANWEARRQS